MQNHEEDRTLPVKIFQLSPATLKPIKIAITDSFDKNTINAQTKTIQKTERTSRLSFTDHYSSHDIPTLLQQIDLLSEISPLVEKIPVIEIPLNIKGHMAVLRIERSSLNRIEAASLCHFDETISQWRAERRFKSTIEKALKAYYPNSPGLFIGSPNKTNEVIVEEKSEVNSALKFEPSDTCTEDLPGSGRKNKKWLLGQIHDASTENLNHNYNTVVLPPSLKTFTLNTLTDETLNKIHRCHKALKIQRLWNAGKGNYYQSLIISDGDRVPSKVFLEELRCFIDTHRPFFFMFEKLANTKNYKHYNRIKTYYETLEINYWDKKLSQQQIPHPKELTIKYPDQYGIGNIGVNLSKIDYDKRYATRKSSLLLFVRELFTSKKLHATADDKKEIETRIKIVAGNRADINAHHQQ
ncbi:MAG: hypothetical protein SFW07_04925 [Gammaproteobacteria bacterium]|nr:hypothetical protein [Gammaproteobacteria bacterium]